ncbi:single-stranded DNA-binding protein [Elusimicrobiota bacterium]
MKEIRLLQQNIALISGYLGRDADFSSTASGTTKCFFSVGVTRRFKDKSSGEWKDDTSWVPVVVWGEAADRLRDKLKKGSPVHVEGRLKSRQWEDKSGQKRSALEIVAQRVQYLAKIGGGGGAPSQGPGGEQPETDLEEVPF